MHTIKTHRMLKARFPDWTNADIKLFCESFEEALRPRAKPVKHKKEFGGAALAMTMALMSKDIVSAGPTAKPARMVLRDGVLVRL